ncbi:MAG: helix-turn-helix domain-containing protein [Pseudomonadota bacterium]
MDGMDSATTPAGGTAAQPIEAFQSRLNGVCGSFDLHVDKPRQPAVSGHVSVSAFGGLDIAEVGLDVDQVTRRRDNIRRDPGNHFFLILQRQGRARLHQQGVTAWMQPGDLFVVDSTQESAFAYGGRYSLQTSVHLPRDEMHHRFGRRLGGSLSIDGSDALAVAMKAVLASLLRTDTVGAQAHTVEAFYSVFGALLSERATGNTDQLSVDAALVQSAETVMAAHHRLPGFNTRAVAERLGVSLRRLQRAYRATGETPHMRLQRYRVEATHRMLLSRAAHADDTVASLAFDAGFSDLSTFYRLYRKRYGRAPGLTLQQPDATRKLR